MIFLLAFLVFESPDLWAAPAVRQAPFENLREQCRKEIAGDYLKILDASNIAKDKLQLYAEKLKKLEMDRSQAKKDLSEKSERAGKSEFDSELARAKDSARTHLQVVEAAIEEISKLLASTKDEMASAERRLSQRRKRIEEVFVFERTTPTPAGAFPYQIQFRSPCPKYRYLCSLPAGEAQALANIFDQDTPQSCVRYSQQASPRK